MIKPFLLLSCLALLFAPRGGTLLEFRIRGDVPAAKRAAVEAAVVTTTLDCRTHPRPEDKQTKHLGCETCGGPLQTRDSAPGETRWMQVELKNDSLRVLVGTWPGLAVLRWSTIETALAGSGASANTRDCMLHGRVFLELGATATAEPAVLARVLAMFGSAEGKLDAAQIPLQIGPRPVGLELLRAAVQSAGYELKDALWLVNQCGGELVTLP